MYPVSERFLHALTVPHVVATRGTYTVPGGDPVPLDIRRDVDPTVTLDTASRSRRRASLSVWADGDAFEAMSTPGCVFDLEHGVRYGTMSEPEYVPVFSGVMSRAERPRGSRAGSMALPLQDRWEQIVACDLVFPATVSAGTTRAQAIAFQVSAVFPGSVTIDDRSKTGGVVSVAKTWTGSRAGMIVDLATDGNLDVYFAGDGSFVIEDMPTSTAQAVWSVKALSEFVNVRPLDKLYNMVVVKPSAVDGSQTWPVQIAKVTDVNHPRHELKIGPRPYVWASPTAATASAAFQAAQTILYRLLGSTDAVKLGALSNPALEGRDVIRVTVPQQGREPADTFSHFVDGFDLNLGTGGMTVTTRKQAVD